MSGWWITVRSGPEQPIGPVVPKLAGERLLLRWRGQDMIQVGERWLFTLKLRVPWGAANPGGFDYRRWLLASGYSLPGTSKPVKDAETGCCAVQSALARQSSQFARATGAGSLQHTVGSGDRQWQCGGC